MKKFKKKGIVKIAENPERVTASLEIGSPEFEIVAINNELIKEETYVEVHFKETHLTHSRTFKYKKILNEQEAEAAILNEPELKGATEKRK